MKIFNFLSHINTIIQLVRISQLKFGQAHCHACDQTTIWVQLNREAYAVRCTSCGSSAIHNACIEAIHTLLMDNIRTGKTHEYSYFGAVHNALKASSNSFTFSEFFPQSNEEYVDGIWNQDIQQLRMADNSYDVQVCTEVLEHVPDYMAALKEVYRVLKPGGKFMFTIPLHSSFQRVAKIDNGLKWIGEEEYHDSQLSGPKSVPVFWHFTKESTINDLQSAGFSKAESIEFNILDSRKLVFLATK